MKVGNELLAQLNLVPSLQKRKGVKPSIGFTPFLFQRPTPSPQPFAFNPRHPLIRFIRDQ